MLNFDSQKGNRSSRGRKYLKQSVCSFNKFQDFLAAKSKQKTPKKFFADTYSKTGEIKIEKLNFNKSVTDSQFLPPKSIDKFSRSTSNRKEFFAGPKEQLMMNLTQTPIQKTKIWSFDGTNSNNEDYLMRPNEIKAKVESNAMQRFQQLFKKQTSIRAKRIEQEQSKRLMKMLQNTNRKHENHLISNRVGRQSHNGVVNYGISSKKKISHEEYLINQSINFQKQLEEQNDFKMKPRESINNPKMSTISQKSKTIDRDSEPEEFSRQEKYIQNKKGSFTKDRNSIDLGKQLKKKPSNPYEILKNAQNSKQQNENMRKSSKKPEQKQGEMSFSNLPKENKQKIIQKINFQEQRSPLKQTQPQQIKKQKQSIVKKQIFQNMQPEIVKKESFKTIEHLEVQKKESVKTNKSQNQGTELKEKGVSKKIQQLPKVQKKNSQTEKQVSKVTEMKRTESKVVENPAFQQKKPQTKVTQVIKNVTQKEKVPQVQIESRHKQGQVLKSTQKQTNMGKNSFKIDQMDVFDMLPSAEVVQKPIVKQATKENPSQNSSKNQQISYQQDNRVSLDEIIQTKTTGRQKTQQTKEKQKTSITIKGAKQTKQVKNENQAQSSSRRNTYEVDELDMDELEEVTIDPKAAMKKEDKTVMAKSTDAGKPANEVTKTQSNNNQRESTIANPQSSNKNIKPQTQTSLAGGLKNNEKYGYDNKPIQKAQQPANVSKNEPQSKQTPTMTPQNTKKPDSSQKVSFHDSQQGEASPVDELGYLLDLVQILGSYYTDSKHFYSQPDSSMVEITMNHKLASYFLAQQYHFYIQLFKRFAQAPKKQDFYALTAEEFQEALQDEEMIEGFEELKKSAQLAVKLIKMTYEKCKMYLKKHQKDLNISKDLNYHQQCREYLRAEFGGLYKLYLEKTTAPLGKRLCYLIETYGLVMYLNGEELKEYEDVEDLEPRSYTQHINKYKNLLGQ